MLDTYTRFPGGVIRITTPRLSIASGANIESQTLSLRT